MLNTFPCLEAFRPRSQPVKTEEFWNVSAWWKTVTVSRPQQRADPKCYPCTAHHHTTFPPSGQAYLSFPLLRKERTIPRLYLEKGEDSYLSLTWLSVPSGQLVMSVMLWVQYLTYCSLSMKTSVLPLLCGKGLLSWPSFITSVFHFLQLHMHLLGSPLAAVSNMSCSTVRELFEKWLVPEPVDALLIHFPEEFQVWESWEV